jgi:ribonuclease G
LCDAKPVWRLLNKSLGQTLNGKDNLISETAKETRIAILENGDLVEFFVEKPEKNRLVGSIFKGKVENVIEGIQAPL